MFPILPAYPAMAGGVESVGFLFWMLGYHALCVFLSCRRWRAMPDGVRRAGRAGLAADPAGQPVRALGPGSGGVAARRVVARVCRPAAGRLIERALADAPSMQLARARLRQAVAVGEQAGAALLPGAALNADVTRQRYSEHGMVPPPMAGSWRTSASSAWILPMTWIWPAANAPAATPRKTAQPLAPMKPARAYCCPPR